MATPAKDRARRVVGQRLIGRLGAWADLRGDLSASRWRSTPVAAVAPGPQPRASLLQVLAAVLAHADVEATAVLGCWLLALR